ncbi:PalH/RIM21-domain-containing protein [Scheffersomyces amazonensis]|uniref:PalH/RIM21-domain-containing protein n=1 Tax=Scheffersomyces amazonensis TaxID=1078765 RepID=UPI00315CD88F
MYWRNSWSEGQMYPSCMHLTLDEGMLVSHDLYSPVQYIKQFIYHQVCYQHEIPMLNTNTGLVIDKFSQPLPIVKESWRDFTRNNARGSFAYSVVSIIYALSVSGVITWFLTIFVLTNYTIRPSIILQASTLLSSVYILVVVIKSIIILHDQQRDGYLHGAKLLDNINANSAVNILDLIVVLLLQINQVQVIMRIFSRQRDKRLTFLVGLVASITSQVIWAVTKFHTFPDNNEAGDILPAFIYLVRIAMGLCYAAIISGFQISKIHYIIANKSIWLISLLTFILIYSPVAFFIADVSNAFVYELSEIFSVVTYVICVVIPWEWCNKFNVIMKLKEKEGVLGRRFYEDELYELDRFELFVEEDTDIDEQNSNDNDNDDNDNDNSHDHNDNSNENSQDNNNDGDRQIEGDSDNNQDTPFTRAKKVLEALNKTKNAFISITDGIIAAGFAIPRSVSISTSNEAKSRNNHMEEIAAQLSNSRFIQPTNETTATATVSNVETNTTVQQAQPSGTRNRRNVYVYSRKEVVIDFSDEE